MIFLDFDNISYNSMYIVSTIFSLCAILYINTVPDSSAEPP